MAMHAAEESNHRPCCTCRESDEGKGKRQRGRVGMSDPTESSRARTPTRAAADTRQRSPRCVLHRAMCAAAAVQLVRCRLPRQAGRQLRTPPTRRRRRRGEEKKEKRTQASGQSLLHGPAHGMGPGCGSGRGARHSCGSRCTAPRHSRGWVDPRFGAGCLPCHTIIVLLAVF